MTDFQLQLALAKMLPEKIFAIDNGNDVRYRPCNFGWSGQEGIIPIIKETEWLHVCWLVEQTLSWRATENAKCEAERYLDELKDSGGVPGCFAHYCSSWQQRALALCKVKGITP